MNNLSGPKSPVLCHYETSANAYIARLASSRIDQAITREE